MKKILLFLCIVMAGTVNGQSLKDLLYSGKLKNDSNSVVRKTDDLNSKIDTVKKKPIEPEKPKVVAVAIDSSGEKVISPLDTIGIVGTDVKDNSGIVNPANTNTAVKDNNKIWKEYIDSLSITLKTEVLSSKKVKDGTYYLFVEYEIAPDGAVSITNVISSPESEFLQEQVKQRIILTAPQTLSPVLNSAGKPTKVKRRHNFNLTKE